MSDNLIETIFFINCFIFVSFLLLKYSLAVNIFIYNYCFAIFNKSKNTLSSNQSFISLKRLFFIGMQIVCLFAKKTSPLI